MKRMIVQLCLLFAAMVLIAVGVSWIFSRPPAMPAVAKPLPDPNGYPLLVSAGSMAPLPNNSFRRMNQQELRALVDSQSNALQLVRTGLGMECQVPVQFTEAYRSNHMRSELVPLRRIAEILAAEGRLAEAEQRTDDAVGSYLDLIRLGANAARGGNVIDAMLGTGIEAMGRDSLQPLRNQLQAKSCRDIVVTLESLDARRESWQQVLENDPDWYHRAQASSLRERLLRLVRSGSKTISPKDIERNFRERTAGGRQVMVDFAARAYELEQHQKPKSIADLVPAYLKAIPLDPFTGTNMVFTP